MTPLMYAVKDNRTSFVERLIDLGSDVGARNNVSNNLLYLQSFTILLAAVSSAILEKTCFLCLEIFSLD